MSSALNPLLLFFFFTSGPDERSIPGNTIALQEDMSFSGLKTIGTTFLSKFECSQMPHLLLKHITFVDSPGVLSGEKQRTQRAYDFTGVTSWFAAKCDLILLLFDSHKLDVSDEMSTESHSSASTPGRHHTRYPTQHAATALVGPIGKGFNSLCFPPEILCA
ncbi:hypothetical protein RIF29_28987 [Crotalaria pallida]|uniref:G domain-containing protein n=1 Tax=Crotalaria pallida TaxID=3830 RepID=A0AAN9EEM7_CROPI